MYAIRSYYENRSGSALRRYVHLGTGNYHPRTARLYTDFGLLTCNEEIGEDVNEVFKQLTGLGLAKSLHHLWQAPFTLHANMLKSIHAEAEAARAGKRSRIIAKMNSLLEPAIMLACRAGKLTPDLVRWSQQSSLCVVMAAPGYPGSYPKGMAITGIEHLLRAGTVFFLHLAGHVALTEK